jgi:hypothetical protein
LDEATPRSGVGAAAETGRAGTARVAHGAAGTGRERWEWLLGVGLLLAVLLAGGVDWWQQERGAPLYHRGVQAAADQHWAAALAAFEAAGGYLDAPARAATARATLQQLSQLYAAARAAETRDDWAAALRDYGSVVALQPDYEAVATRLPAARTALLQQQAAGAIYGTIGPGGGLSLARGPGLGAWRLPGSDAVSRVRLYAAGRWVIYDGIIWPAIGAHGDPTHRVLRLADRAAPAQPSVTLLPADLPPDGTAQPAPGGFWWFSADLPPPGVVYYDYATGTATPLPVRPGWTVNTTDPVHGWLLLAQPGRAADGSPRTTLYLSTATGVIFDLLGAVPGTVQAAQISADGRYVLFSNTPGPQAGPRTWTQLMLVQRGVQAADPRLSRRLLVLETLDWPADGGAAGRLTARFLPGSGPVQVLSDHSDADGRRQTLYNLETGLQYTVWGRLPPPLTATAFDLSAGGGLVLTQHPERAATRLVLQSATQLTTRHELRVPSTPDSTVSVRLTAPADYLLITVGNPRSNQARQRYTLYTAPLGADGVPGPPTALVSGLYAPALVPAPQPQPAPGGAALLYLTPTGALQVLTLDGAVCGGLATDVRRVWVP